MADHGLRVFLYDADDTDGQVSLRDVTVEQLTSDQLLWIDIYDEQGVAAAAATLGLAAETVGRLLEPSAQAELFVHEGYVHLVVVAPERSALRHEPLLLDCLVGSNWVLTVHRQPIGLLDHFDEVIRGDSGLGKIDGQGFVAAILHEHVMCYLAELRPIEAELDRLDLRSMTGRMHEDALLHELVGTRLRLARLRRLLEPHREIYARLLRSEFAILSGSESTSDFESLTDLLERTLQAMEVTREMIIGSFEIYTTWAAHGTNKLMKRLTLASVTLLPPTLLAGIMGMNSLPKLLASGAAFWLTLTAMAGLGLSVLSLARRREWI